MEFVRRRRLAWHHHSQKEVRPAESTRVICSAEERPAEDECAIHADAKKRQHAPPQLRKTR